MGRSMIEVGAVALSARSEDGAAIGIVSIHGREAGTFDWDSESPCQSWKATLNPTVVQALGLRPHYHGETVKTLARFIAKAVDPKLWFCR